MNVVQPIYLETCQMYVTNALDSLNLGEVLLSSLLVSAAGGKISLRY